MRQLIILITLFCSTLQASGQNEKLLDSVSFFPRTLYSEVGNKIDSMSFIWRSKLLADFHEPKLFSQQTKSVYRFTWTRSFHEIVIIRLTLSGDSGTLLTKTEIRAPTQKESKTKKLPVSSKLKYRIDSLSIGHNIIADFQKVIHDKGFWEMTNSWNLFTVHDGAGWLLEVNDREKGYKMLYRHSPGKKEQSFKDICLFLIRLTQDSEKLEVY
ncbi:MAG: hypothetical protein ACK5DD_16560 [Cyclobacteriaceae bacterium]|jgi:hypothetical protein